LGEEKAFKWWWARQAPISNPMGWRPSETVSQPATGTKTWQELGLKFGVFSWINLLKTALIAKHFWEREKKRRWTIHGASCAPVLVLIVQSEFLYDSLVGREPGTAAQPRWGIENDGGGKQGLLGVSKKEKSRGGTRKQEKGNKRETLEKRTAR